MKKWNIHLEIWKLLALAYTFCSFSPNKTNVNDCFYNYREVKSLDYNKNTEVFKTSLETSTEVSKISFADSDASTVCVL